MNFLSHYYFERYSRNPELVLGCVLPDLIKNADKDINVLPHKHESHFDGNPKLAAIYRGWGRHVEADRYFHNAPFFYTHTHELKALLAPAVADTPIRPSFLSHIALELLLDHLLLHHQAVHESDFYECLAAADRDAIARFLKFCDVQDTTFFFTYFNSFMRAQYIGSYRHFDQITYAVINICRRLWDVQLSISQQQRMTEAFAHYATELDRSFRSIFDDLETHLS
ncbi:hypothetical protein [Parapedobacter sp. 10938]|uniref:hypothetical protein n=1 Tax=Parapedobacter flavus TaxID=3110225 RepID=UPI002DB7B801|nr:hypothetical protein [Parapedobacter sp. 10938]MEC3881084.1 hypothetical protein [Parapedobacter sp. 10938]